MQSSAIWRARVSKSVKGWSSRIFSKKLDLQMSAVNIAGEIEDVDLNHPARIGHDGPIADVSDGRQGLRAQTAHPCGKNTVHRRGAPMKVEVGGRKPHRASPGLPVHHATGHEIRPAEHGNGVAQQAFAQACPDAGATHPLAGREEGICPLDKEAVALGALLKHGEIAAAMAAKLEIVTHDEAAHPQTLNQQALHEIVGRTRRQCRAKRQHQQTLNAQRGE